MKVLFISHSASRSGAVLLLLSLLRWLKANTDISCEVLLAGKGPLCADFAALAPLYTPVTQPARAGVVKCLLQPLGSAAGKLAGLLPLRKNGRGGDYDLVYANTVMLGDVLEVVAPPGCPVVTHVHELDRWISHAGEQNFERVKRHTDRYVAASGAVRDNLVAHHGIPVDRVEVVHSFIPTRGISANPEGIRERLGIPDDSLVVLGSGHESWCKGKDLFVLLASHLRDLAPGRPPHFLWVGGWQHAEERRNILHDVEHLGLSGQVHFSGEVANPLDYFAAGDLFALVSREDSFPLAGLEAAALGKPVLCFANAGGMPEFVQEDAGFVVPYLDLPAMARKIAVLYEDPLLRRRLGESAANRARGRHDVAAGAERIYRIIREFDKGP